MYQKQHLFLHEMLLVSETTLKYIPFKGITLMITCPVHQDIVANSTSVLCHLQVEEMFN